jgi:hypothetical protein
MVAEAAQGEHPLDPLFFRDIFQPYQELSQQGGCPGGGDGHMKSWRSHERLFVSMRISTEPFFITVGNKIRVAGFFFNCDFG